VRFTAKQRSKKYSLSPQTVALITKLKFNDNDEAEAKVRLFLRPEDFDNINARQYPHHALFATRQGKLHLLWKRSLAPLLT
jgi:hypothetical protein